MSIIEEQTENVIIESDPDEPDNQPNEHPNGQLNTVCSGDIYSRIEKLKLFGIRL